MLLFMLAAGGILAYGAAYALFCIKKGGIAGCAHLDGFHQAVVQLSCGQCRQGIGVDKHKYRLPECAD